MVRHLSCLAVLLLPLASFAEGLSEAQLKNAMRPYMRAVRDCVERQHELDSSVSGRMDLMFTIGNRGRVTKVEVLTENHFRTYAAGCVGGVLRSVKFPRFSGKPVEVPHFPVPLKGADPDGTIEEDEESPPKPKEAHHKLKKPVLKRLKMATGTIRACVNDHKEKPRRKRKQRTTTLSITFTLNPLGRVAEVNVLTKAHSKDYMAGCVYGVLAFVEFPYQGSVDLKFSRAVIPRL